MPVWLLTGQRLSRGKQINQLISITTYTSATDNKVKTKTLTKEELIDILLADPLLIRDKTAGPAWSPAGYTSATRDKTYLTTLSCLPLDFDKGADGRDGLTDEEVDALEHDLEGLEYVRHTSYSNGACHPRTKLRIVLFLDRAVRAAEYTRLWDKVVTSLSVKPDKTRRAPAAIYFLPACPPEHGGLHWCDHHKGDELVVESGGLPDLNNAPAPGDALTQLRTATEKEPALNKAGYVLGMAAALDGATEPPLKAVWEKCRAALAANVVSAPVADWSAAEATCNEACEHGFKEGSAKVEIKKEFTPTMTQVSKAKDTLKKLSKVVEEDPLQLQTAAYILGRFVPHVIGEEAVRNGLVAAVEQSGTLAYNKIEADVKITLGLEKGKRAPMYVQIGWRNLLKMDKEKGTYLVNEENVATILKHHPDMRGVLGRNVRTGGLTMRTLPPWTTTYTDFPVRMRDCDWSDASNWVTDVLGGALGRQRMLSALSDAAALNVYDPFKDWLESLKWDGVPRLDTWLNSACGVDQSEYTQLVGSKWLISAVARTMDPGCRAQHVLVFLGEQGLEKSRMLSALAGEEFFSDDAGEVGTPAASFATEKFVIIELSELVGFRKADQETIKRFITATREEIRRPYAREAELVVRRAVFAGTTNEREFLKDPTGGRRFWPVECPSWADTAWVVANRTQLWAEAAVRHGKGETWWLSREEEKLAKAVQMEHSESDDLMERLNELEGPVVDQALKIALTVDQLDGNRAQWLTMKQMYDFLGLEITRKADQYRLGDLIKRKGWKRETITRDGKRIKGIIIRR